MSRPYKIIIAVSVGTLIIFSTLFGDIINIFDDYSGVMLVVITAIYTYSTHKIFQVSNAQMIQMQKQHKQKIGIDLFDRRISVLKLVQENQVESIELSAVKFLFDEKIYRQTIQLYAMQSDVKIQKAIDDMLVSSIQSKNPVLHMSYNFEFIRATSFDAQKETLEDFDSVLQEVFEAADTEQSRTVEIKNSIHETIELIRNIGKLRQQTCIDMSDFIDSSIA